MADYFIELREVEGRGKAIFAQKDLFPGQLILTEEPLLFVNDNDMFQFKNIWFRNNYDIAQLFCMWSKFQVKPFEIQAKILTLHGPLEGQAEQIFATTIVPIFQWYCSQHGCSTSLSENKFELFLKLSSICKFNSFGFGGDGSAVYDTATRFAHSCLPNTSRTFDGNKIEIRVILPVKQGEELTSEYNPDHRSKPTHFRRHRYLLTKEFTCHCPRCDALGDDTRQFNCSDAKCSGYHLVCQPVNQDPFVLKDKTPVNDLAYTGVEYVEPYLLPCDVCFGAASVEYQAEMFAFEARMPAIIAPLVEEYKGIGKPAITSGRLTFSQWTAFAQKVKTVKFPLKHTQSSALIGLTQRIAVHCTIPSCTPFLTAAQKEEGLKWCGEAIHNYIAHAEAVLGMFPNCEMAEQYQFAGTVMETVDLAVAVTYMQKAMRVGAIVYGRKHAKQREAETLFVKMIERVQKGQIMACFSRQFKFRLSGITGACLFCGQSCEGTAFSLMKCSTCKDAAYCSRECQALHWKFHKQRHVKK